MFAAENFGALTASGEWNGQFGRYPPALDETLAQAKNFQQLEDFNLKRCATWTLLRLACHLRHLTLLRSLLPFSSVLRFLSRTVLVPFFPVPFERGAFVVRRKKKGS